LTGQRLKTIISNWKTAFKYIILYSLVLIFCDRLMMTEFEKFSQPPTKFGPKAHSKSGFKNHHGMTEDLNLELDHHQEMSQMDGRGKQKKRLIHQEGINHMGKKHAHRILEVEGKQSPHAGNENEDKIEELQQHFKGMDPEELEGLLMDIPVETQEEFQELFGDDFVDLLDPGMMANLGNVDKQELAMQVKQLREMEKKMNGRVATRVIKRFRGSRRC
jgi:hypothetical protein